MTITDKVNSSWIGVWGRGESLPSKKGKGKPPQDKENREKVEYHVEPRSHQAMDTARTHERTRRFPD